MLTCLTILTGARIVGAEPSSYHLVGWANTLVPGAGRAILGDNQRALIEAAAELSTFSLGFSLSRLSPMTIDGVPPSIPRLRTRAKGGARVETVDFKKGIYAEGLQIFGIKAHMTNTFLAYRAAGAPGVDQTDTADLFLAPFKKKVLANPWVYWGITTSLLGVVLDYTATLQRGVPKHARVSAVSTALYDTTAIALVPFGSGAPEEMFYRGFLQNELLQAFSTPYAAIPVSTTAFALSHQAGIDQIVAALTGFYMGVMTYRHDGQLSPGIAYHFWSDILVGIESAVLLSLGQTTRPAKVNFSLSW